MRVALALAAFAAILAVTAANGYVAPCLNPVCKPTCVPKCNTAVLKCTNTTTVSSVCNFKCAVPAVDPKPAYKAAVAYKPSVYGYGRKLQSDYSYVQAKPYYNPKKVAYVPKDPVVVKPPVKPAPVPYCTQTCQNVTGFILACQPAPCTQLVNKTRTTQKCGIQCDTPTAVPYTAVSGRKLQNYADPTNNCYYKCVDVVETYVDAVCLPECQAQDCSGPQTCTCSKPEPVKPPVKPPVNNTVNIVLDHVLSKAEDKASKFLSYWG